jgi:Fe-S-cluster containining protein
MLKGPGIIGHRYGKTHIERQQDGKRLLAALPKRKTRETVEIKRILSSYHCRTCAKCCRGAFSIGDGEKEYARIMKLVNARKKEFLVECMGKGESGTKYYDIGVPIARAACGFLSWEGGKINHYTLLDSSGKDRDWKPFSCEIYNSRASVCMAYPLNVTWMQLELGKGGRNREGTVIIDAACPAIHELLEKGIGHLTESEIISLSAGPDIDENSLLFSLPKSLQELKKMVGEAGKWSHILVNEEGERAYPLNAWEIFI